jgi:very-short-patch-repair endonuclease
MVKPVSFAQTLRQQQTPAERRFWAMLHAWRSSGWHFRRQSPIGVYVVDFVCKRHRLVIEIDGDSHYSPEGLAHDFRRTAHLARRGYRVLRYTNREVMDNPDGVFEHLCGVLGRPG